MNIDCSGKRLDPDEYLAWLTTYACLLDDFTALLEKEGWVSEKATMVSFLRAAEHSFNFFINHRITYEMIYDESEKNVSKTDGSPRITYLDLKIKRDNIADRISNILESGPEYQKRFNEFCDNMKEPRMLGCGL